jgi:hypothetical protein
MIRPSYCGLGSGSAFFGVKWPYPEADHLFRLTPRSIERVVHKYRDNFSCLYKLIVDMTI